jgi:hypothetical protein
MENIGGRGWGKFSLSCPLPYFIVPFCLAKSLMRMKKKRFLEKMRTIFVYIGLFSPE